MKNESKALSLICLASLVIPSWAFCSALTGRLEKFGALGLLPASYINVTLSKNNGENLKTIITESDGKYCFNDIEPGSYVLKVWVKGLDNDPLTRDVEVLKDKELTDAGQILIHFFIFEFPKEQVFPSADLMGFIKNEGYRFRARGSHYALPDDADIWPVFKCKNGNYLLSTEKPVLIKKDGKWISREILIDRPVEEILAVLVAREGDHYFRFLMLSNDRAEFNQLPKNSCILATRRISFE